MNDSRTGLEGMTKRELLERLIAEVSAWPGDVALEKTGRERVEALLAQLGACPLWSAETHWRALCCTWLERAGHPDIWLRNCWLQTLQQWLCCLDALGLDPDALPDFQPPALHRLPPSYPPPEPGHLPFGFVRPLV